MAQRPQLHHTEGKLSLALGNERARWQKPSALATVALFKGKDGDVSRMRNNWTTMATHLKQLWSRPYKVGKYTVWFDVGIT
eukprot:3315909-Rhodomonas_salina.1